MRTSSIHPVSFLLTGSILFVLGCGPQQLWIRDSSEGGRIASTEGRGFAPSPSQSAGFSVAPSGENRPYALVGHTGTSHDQHTVISGGGSASPQTHSMSSPNTARYDSQEFLRDGGDASPLVVHLNDQSLRGLQPEDTIVHYKTGSGEVEIQASNQVALYAPRFRSVRQISGALAGGRAVGTAQMDRPIATVKVDQPLPGLVMRDSLELGHADVARGPDAIRERDRGVPLDSVQQVNLAANVMAALVNLTSDQAYSLQGEQKALFDRYANAAVTYQLDECLEVAIQSFRTPSLVRDQRVDGFTIYDFEEGKGRVQISKFADREDAKPGDVVTFGVRIENVGDGPVNEIVVVDNLTTRLEYVPDSLDCDAEVDFQSIVNEAQSLRLQWTLRDSLGVGESVTIQFKCRVR